ncbi:hypothetical protein VTK73DRAFT_7873 [Phialemonium thermophilum]|uniref:Uncharacterized protein n=1 Tax=Phialemonium thermophilum TaxID=223376 RepID=A0ABR3XSN0_9PEZI
MADVIGVISSAITIWEFFDSLFGNSSPAYTTVRVAAALNGNGLSGADGTVSSIRTYNENQGLIGNSGSLYVANGGFTDFQIDQANDQQATYIQVYASDDAICIPYISVTWVDGGKYGWVGDWGQECGLEWYYGNVYVDNSGNAPDCTWIDSDHTNGIQATELMIHLPSFASQDPHSSDPSSFCGYPALRAYNGGSEIFKKRDATTADPAPDTRLVVSSISNHNATRLCDSKTSRGPDMVSLSEGVFCDMETRQTMPLCGTAAASSAAQCFDVDAHTTAQSHRSVAKKNYSKVLVWNGKNATETVTSS